jgi:hypothetical protein
MSPANRAPVTGDVLTLLGPQPTQLSAEKKPCRQITIRAHIENVSVASIGPLDVSHGMKRWGFVLEGETYTIGPFGPGIGIRPCDIYIVGTQDDSFTWGGFWA